MVLSQSPWTGATAAGSVGLLDLAGAGVALRDASGSGAVSIAAGGGLYQYGSGIFLASTTSGAAAGSLVAVASAHVSISAGASSMLALAAGLAWFWAPICAALSCAGGGVLRDILVNQEPQTFKGVIYEEAAIVGGLVLTVGLFIANQYESSAVPVLLSVGFTFLFIILLRLAIYHYHLQYPEILGGPKKPK